MIRVKGVPQAKTIGERGRSKEDRIIVESDNRPQPCGRVEDEQEDGDRDDFTPNVLLPVIEKIG